MATSIVRLTLIIDKSANKILCAEAGKDFVDIVINLLSLPIGTIFKLHRNSSTVGCIRNLYTSLDNLSEAFLQTNHTKDDLLKPQVASGSSALNSQTNQTKYKCMQSQVVRESKVRKKARAKARAKSLSRLHQTNVIGAVGTPNLQCTCTKPQTVSAREGGIVKELVTYMVTDDLSVTPLSMPFVIDLMQHNVKDLTTLEIRIVEFGTDEVRSKSLAPSFMRRYDVLNWVQC